MAHPISVKETLNSITAFLTKKSEFSGFGSIFLPKNTNKRERGDELIHGFYKEKQKRGRSSSISEIITSSPYQDGYQWRKYGEKKILRSQYPRCYYRCTYSGENNCKATKQVQQNDDSDPVLYKVTYFVEHTCTESTMLSQSKSAGSQFIMDFSAKTSIFPFATQSSPKNVTESSSGNEMDQMGNFVTSDQGDSASFDVLNEFDFLFSGSQNVDLFHGIFATSNCF